MTGPPASEEISLVEMVNAVLRRWRLVAALPLTVSFVVAVVMLLTPSRFTSSTAFTPEAGTQGRLPAGLAGLAGQFGINLGAEARQSAQFYASVIRSPDIINRVLTARYPDPRTTDLRDSASLLVILEIEGDSLADSLHSGRKKLEGMIGVGIDPPTNIVTLSFTSRYPTLAAAVANQFIAYLNEFNATSRQSQARAARRFAEERMNEANRELEAAEEAERRFYERNRTWQQSPQLTFEHERLQRQVRITQEIALTLRREYETARIGEVNDTPVITVVYAAVPAQEKSGPRRRLLVILAFMVAGAAAVFGALVLEYAAHLRRSDAVPHKALREVLGQIRRDLGSVVRR